MAKKSIDIYPLIKQLQNYGDVIYLDSQKVDHPASEKSYLAGKPKAWIKAWGNQIRIFENNIEQSLDRNPWQAFKEFREIHKGWVFGYFGYDLKNSIEDLFSNNSDSNSMPDLFFMVPEFLIEISIDGEHKYILGEELAVKKAPIKSSDFRFSLAHQISKAEYIQKIKQAKLEIKEGEYYEINLTHPIEYRFEGEPLSLYRKMKLAGPVPFAAFTFIDEISICCSSPERFLSRTGNTVCSQPIKGTISNEFNLDRESVNIQLKSEKNKAENLMIVDLVRNDMNKIAINGTVKVKNLFEIQSFETVHQMVSTVECLVEENEDSVDIIKACFPMGSMTGAPKVAVMNAIERLETYKRGIYSGAIGYFAPNGDFDFNVVIRTAIIENGKLLYSVGGAITSDSDPNDEWTETLIKAKALSNAQN